VLLPAVIDPQDIVGILFVQALSEYTAMFGEVVTVPEEPMFWLTDVTAIVLAAKENAKIAKIIVSIFCTLCDVITFPANKQ